jgi:hypothetical protein
VTRLVALLAPFALAGCSLLAPGVQPVPPTPLPIFAVTLDTPDGEVGVVRKQSGLELVFVNGGGGTSAQFDGQAPHIYLITYGGETGQTYNSYVYGVAPAGATSVEFAGFDAPLRSPIVGGTFLVALKEKEVKPSDLHWTFLSGAGAVILRGSSITR